MTLNLTPLEVADAYRLVGTVFNRHCDENHNADFEACDVEACRLAYLLEQSLGGVEAMLTAVVMWEQKSQEAAR